MADLTSGASAKVQIDPGKSIRVEAEGGTTNVTSLYGAPAGTTPVTGSQVFGPYGVPAMLRVACASGSCSYSQVADPVLTPAEVTATKVLMSGDWISIPLSQIAAAAGVSYSLSDLTPALQAALNAYVPGASYSLAGKAVQLPAAAGYLLSQLVLPSGMRGAVFVGQPGSSLRKTFNGDVFRNESRLQALSNASGQRPVGLAFIDLDLGNDYTPSSGKAYGDLASWQSGPSGNLLAGFIADDVSLSRCTLTGLGASGRFIAPAGDRWKIIDVELRACRTDVGSGGCRVLWGTDHHIERLTGYSGDEFLQVVASTTDGKNIGYVKFRDCTGFSTSARGLNVALGEQGKEDQTADYLSFIERVDVIGCRVRGEIFDVKVNVEAEGRIGYVSLDVESLPVSYGIPASATSRGTACFVNVIRFAGSGSDKPSIGELKIRMRCDAPGKETIACSVSSGTGRAYQITSMSRTSNVVTAQTRYPHGLTTGGTFTVAGADAGFLGTFAAATGSGTTLTWAQTAANATAVETGELVVPYTVGEQATADARTAIGHIDVEDIIAGAPVNWLPKGLELDGATARPNGDGTAPAPADGAVLELRGYERLTIRRYDLTTARGQCGMMLSRLGTAGDATIFPGGKITGLQLQIPYPAGGSYAAQTTVEPVAGVRLYAGRSLSLGRGRYRPTGTPDIDCTPVKLSNDSRPTGAVWIAGDYSDWPSTHTYVSGPAGTWIDGDRVFPAGYLPDDLADTSTLSTGVYAWNGTDTLLRVSGASAKNLTQIAVPAGYAQAGRITVFCFGAGTTTIVAGTTSPANIGIGSNVVLTQNLSQTLAYDAVSALWRRA